MSHCSSWQFPDAAVSDSRCALQDLWLLRASMHWENRAPSFVAPLPFSIRLISLGELRNTEKCPQRAKTFMHPSPHRSLPGAPSCTLLCSYPEHKRLSPDIPYQTICFLKHNYFQGPAEEEGNAGREATWSLVMQHPTAQGSSSLLPHAWPDTSLCCSFSAWHPHAEHAELAVLFLFAWFSYAVSPEAFFLFCRC